MPHFFTSDLIQALAALVLGIPLILVPGFGLGSALNLFSFRSLSPNVRWSLAPLLGLTMTPILLYLPFRLVNVSAMWLMEVFLFSLGIYACRAPGTPPQCRSIPAAAKAGVIVWLLIGTCLTLDVAVDSRLYPSSVIIDTSYRSQVISSLANTTYLPPESYFFHPGHAVPLRYHYIYFLLPALMVQISRNMITSGMALVGLVLWTGIAMFSTLSAVIRFFWHFDNQSRANTAAWSLLGVGGLDLLFAGSEMLWRHQHNQFIFTSPDIGLWNGWGSAFSWLSTSLWSPHHLGGLMAGSIGCLLLWHSRGCGVRTRWVHAAAAALAFATLAGTSIYVCAVFALFLFVVTVELLLNAPRYAPPVAFAGSLSAILILPFFSDVRPAAGAPAFFSFQVRPLAPITALLQLLGIRSHSAWNLSYLLALPLTYTALFGGFFIGGIWWLYKHREHSPELMYRNHMIIGLGAISILVSSFVSSGTEISNDLGYRGLIPAQFLLLICTADMLTAYRRQPTTRRLIQLGVVFLAIGVGSNLLEMIILRGGIGATSETTIQVPEMFRQDITSRRLYALRKAYTWVRNNTPKNSVIQESPITWQLIALDQYSQRRTAVYGSSTSYIVGDNHSEYLATYRDVLSLFSTEMTQLQRNSLCQKFHIDYLVTQPGDRVWNTMPTGSVVYADSLVRVLHCSSDAISTGTPIE